MSKVILEFDHYISESVAKSEVDKVFLNSWLFACFGTDIPKQNDFFVKKYPFGEVVILNLGESFTAFFNICPHRFSKLFLQNQGNSIIECPYHGWRFNGEGIPYAVPFKKECFGKDFEPENYKLSKIQCEVVGNFIFVKVKDDDVDLIRFLGEKYLYLKEISQFLKNRIDNNEMEIKSNWKLVIENSLEDYHLLKIHPETLSKVLSSNYESHTLGFCSSTNIKLKELSRLSLSKLATFFESKFDIDDYRHDFIFPNLAIATTEGLSFFVQEAWPVSVGVTKFISHGFLNDFKPGLSDLVRENITSNFIKTNRNVFIEDAQVCEGIQEALTLPVILEGVLGSREDRVKQFQEVYLHFMSSDKN